MTRDETVALFLECEAKRAEAHAAALTEGKPDYDAIAHEAGKAHWNTWADALLAERKAMETDGRWAAGEADWGVDAETDFSFCLFLNNVGVNEEKEADLKAAIEKRASEAGRDVKSVSVEAEATRFNGFVFPGLASFDSAAFSADASFNSAAFSGDAWFNSAAFSGDASFNEAKFRRYPAFSKAGFSGDTWFDGAIFIEDSQFRGLTFARDIFFRNAKFGPGRADFGLATFERVVQFDGAVFTGEADFNAVSGKRTFSMAGAKFEGAPNFIQAHFEEAPRLDNVVVTPTKAARPNQRPRRSAAPRLPQRVCGARRRQRRFAPHVWLLYGLEMYAGQNPVPIVPSAVSTASAIQKLISGVLIFLFGLALRNMLKVK